MLILVINEMGFYLGFEKDDAIRHLYYLKRATKLSRKGGTVLIRTCASLKEAQHLIEKYVTDTQLDIFPYEIIIGQLVFFRYVKKFVSIIPGKGSFLFRSDGTIIINHTSSNPLKYHVDPKTFKPDRSGMKRLRKNGFLEYFLFPDATTDSSPNGLVHIIECDGKYRIE